MHPAGDKGFGQMWGVVIEASFGPIGVSFSYGYSGAVATGPINSLFDEELPVNLTPPPLIPNNIQQVLNFVLFRQPVDWGSVMGGSACNPICDAQKAPANNADPTLDNRANALAQAINKTGVQSLNNPCTVVGWYAASAIAGGGGVAVANTPEMAATVEAEYPSLVHRVLTWLNGLRPRGGTVSAAIAVVRAAPAQIKDTCSKLQ
jgi:hypothetical protein